MQSRRGKQIIGWDPRSEQIVSWTFDSSGGHGMGAWNAMPEGWRIDSTGVTADGQPTSSKDHLIRVPGENNVFGWRSADRKLGDTKVPDVPEVVFDRVTQAVKRLCGSRSPCVSTRRPPIDQPKSMVIHRNKAYSYETHNVQSNDVLAWWYRFFASEPIHNEACAAVLAAASTAEDGVVSADTTEADSAADTAAFGGGSVGDFRGGNYGGQ